MIRIGALGFMWELSYVVGAPIGALLFNHGGYNLVLGTSFLLYVFASFIGFMSLRTFEEKVEKTDTSVKGWFL